MATCADAGLTAGGARFTGGDDRGSSPCRPSDASSARATWLRGIPSTGARHGASSASSASGTANRHASGTEASLSGRAAVASIVVRAASRSPSRPRVAGGWSSDPIDWSVLGVPARHQHSRKRKRQFRHGPGY